MTELNANPADMELRDVFADWLEERGYNRITADALAVVIRWKYESPRRQIYLERDDKRRCDFLVFVDSLRSQTAYLTVPDHISLNSVFSRSYFIRMIENQFMKFRAK